MASCKVFRDDASHASVRDSGAKIGVKHLGQQFRSLFDKNYRRAFRSLRNLPRIRYDYVIDGGAAAGAFTDSFLRLHSPEKLVMVEAIPDIAEKLRWRYAGNSTISVVAAALADKDGSAQFEVNRLTDSSSLLPIDPRNSQWFGRDLRVARTIQVPTISLPTLLEQNRMQTVDLLKLDLQGAERAVLSGGEAVLDRIKVIYSEVFFAPLYANAWLFRDIEDFLCRRGFQLCGLSNVVHSGEGELLQANATFRRSDLGYSSPSK